MKTTWTRIAEITKWTPRGWELPAAGLALGLIDTLALAAIGFEFTVAGRDATFGMALFLALSFAFLGLVMGEVLRVRRREAEAHAALQRQMEETARIQTRLAQSEKLASLGQLAGVLAHEVRNPLAIIRSQVQNLAEEPPEDWPQAVTATCREVIEEIDRLSSVTSSLVRFARPLRVKGSEVKVESLLGRVEVLARPLLQPRSLRLRLEAGQSASQSLYGDFDLLCQVLLGLIANAAQASPEGAEIHLRSELRGDAFIFMVDDPGPGIPPDQLERIFEPFFTTRRQGNGLGLAVARQIVHSHGGRIQAGQSPAGGARITFSIPLGAARKGAA
ncbi:MAG TPA: ATP-binding protein [Acidobacteriota bacterium]|nr:ATP-binding protein [Acidobacteriota bacterium]